MDKAFEKVKEFHKTFNHPIKETPEMLCIDRLSTRIIWMRSELEELEESNTLIEQVDALVDLMYFAIGTLVEMGVKPENLFNIVHDANMKKCWKDGKPRFRGDGKVIKPAGWVPPDKELLKEIMRQGEKECK